MHSALHLRTGNNFADLHDLLGQNLIQLQQMLALLLLRIDLAGRQRFVLLEGGNKGSQFIIKLVNQ